MRRRPRQLPIPFDGEVPTIDLPAQTAQDLVNALADLLLATAVDVHDDDDDEERDDAHEDHR